MSFLTFHKGYLDKVAKSLMLDNWNFSKKVLEKVFYVGFVKEYLVKSEFVLLCMFEYLFWYTLY